MQLLLVSVVKEGGQGLELYRVWSQISKISQWSWGFPCGMPCRGIFPQLVQY